MDYDEKKRKAIKALKEIDPTKPYGPELFNAIARVSVSFGIEIVALRLGKGIDGLEVFLTKRPDNDPFWPEQWHCPGTILRPGEEFSDAFKRLEKDEFLTHLKEVNFVGFLNHNNTPRGHIVSHIYTASVDGAKNGKWFPTDQLPDKTLYPHREKTIPLAISRYGMIPLWTRTKE